MRATKAGWAAAGVIVLAVVMCLALGTWQVTHQTGVVRVWHHEQAAVADPTIGGTEIPPDFLVDDTFTSHLPLVIIDTAGEKIVNYKYYDEATDSYRYKDGVDPYVNMTLSVIDNANHVNTLRDAPSLQTDGKIKIRGNSSSALPKAQYRMQLLDEQGYKISLPLLGMDAGEEWVLNGTQRDLSYMRNYLAYNLAGELDPYNTDVRYCEVLKKVGDQYQYEGIYLAIEPVDQGKGRVDITRYDEQVTECAYIVRRDRLDTTELQLDTYATLTGINRTWTGTGVEEDGYLSLLYPKEKKVTQASLEYIEEDISRVERLLYSDSRTEFLRYPEYLDVESFINYFLINELLTSYDAGIHSTYFYKDIGGKITMGPCWDFDGGVDNAGGSLTNFQYLVMPVRPWYDRLVTDRRFVVELENQYDFLRRGLFSNETLEGKIRDTAAFLGNAVQRDRSRWSAVYKDRFIPRAEGHTGLMIDRDRQTYDQELQRLIDGLLLHADYMDTHLVEVEQYIQPDMGSHFMLAITFLLIFFLSIVLTQRARKT